MRLATTLSVFALPVYGAIHESLVGLPFGWSESDAVVDDSTKVSMMVAVYVVSNVTDCNQH